MADSNRRQTNSKFPDDEVKAPNLIERAKEEFEAILHSQKKSPQDQRETHGQHDCINENTSLEEVKAPNMFERAKEEFEAIAQVLHLKKGSPIHYGRDETQMAESKHKQESPCAPSENNAKAANVFVRAKEEIEAIIHHHDKSTHHHHHKETHGMSDDIDENTPINEVKGPNVFERVKEEFEAIVQAMHPKKES